VKKHASQVVSLLSEVIYDIPTSVSNLGIQLDGSSENWNITLLAFLNHLAEENIFESVTVHRLPVGHTHEDIDQLFSVISQTPREKELIHSPMEFEQLLSQMWANPNAVQVRRIHNVLDAFYQPHITKHLRGLGHLSRIHVIRLEKQQNRVRLYYKEREIDENWQPTHSLDHNGVWVEDSCVDGWDGVLLQIPDISSCPALLPEDEFWTTHRESIQTAINNLTSTTFPLWNGSDFGPSCLRQSILWSGE